jgi:type I restriction enzyme M protein
VEADLVECIVALPPQLFLTTGIAACLWFVTRDKSGRNLRNNGRDRKGETLFIDARALGEMQTRTLRVLSGSSQGETVQGHADGDPKPDSDIGRIIYPFRQWRGEKRPDWWNEDAYGKWSYRDAAGFCRAETIEGIGKQGFVLTPARYVGAAEQGDDGEPFAKKYPRLIGELDAYLRHGEELTQELRMRLSEVQA